MSKDLKSCQRSRHIERRYLKVHECVAQGDIVARGMPQEFATLVQRMVDHRARLRPSLNEVYACLLTMPLPPAAAVIAPTPSVSAVAATPSAAVAAARATAAPPPPSKAELEARLQAAVAAHDYARAGAVHLQIKALEALEA